MTFTPAEFIRRLSLHILPKQFVRFVIMVFLAALRNVKSEAVAREIKGKTTGKSSEEDFIIHVSLL